MSDRFFIDSNVLLYSIEDSRLSTKKTVALSILSRVGFVSPQVLFECLNVCVRKLELSKPAALSHIHPILHGTWLQPENAAVVS